MNIAFLIGRIIFGGYWLMAGFNHFKNLNYMSEYAKAKGTPSPKLAGPERRMRELLFAHRHCGLCPRKRDLAFGLALFQRPMLRIGYYHDLCQAPGEPADRMEILIALERHGDVKSARTGRLDIRR
jgi:hypothetical protein